MITRLPHYLTNEEKIAWGRGLLLARQVLLCLFCSFIHGAFFHDYGRSSLFFLFLFVYSDRVLLSIVKRLWFFPRTSWPLFTSGVDSIVPLIRVWASLFFFFGLSIFRWFTARIMYIPNLRYLTFVTTLIAASLLFFFSLSFLLSFFSIHTSKGFLDS